MGGSGPRPGPTVLRGVDPTGAWREMALVRDTLVLVVKPGCDSCRPFLAAAPPYAHGDVVVVTSHEGPWAEARGVWRAREWLRAWRADAAPCYLVIDPRGPLIRAEGALFTWDQVLREVGPPPA